MKVVCIDNKQGSNHLTVGKEYEVLEEKDSFYLVRNDRGIPNYYSMTDFFRELSQQEGGNKIDRHYNFKYTLSTKEKEEGVLKIDPYFIAKQWKLGKKDDSGVLFHCLKTLARFGDKNSVEREIKALHLQVKRLAELENVTLD